MLTRALARPLACIVVCLTVVAGCSDQDPETSPSSSVTTASTPTGTPSGNATETPTDEPTATPTVTPTGTATGTPTTSAPAPSGSATPAPTGAAGSGSSPRPGGRRGRLLSAAEVPGFNDGYRWSQGSTSPEDPSTSFGTCQRFGILSIGAEQAVVRRYRPASGPAGTDRAGELVATFPDEKTARRAYAVLEAWRARCADRLEHYRRAKVGGLQDVSVGDGAAGWYLLTYGPAKGEPDAGYFDAQGMTRVGSRIAMLSMVATGQDFSYEPGQEPMVEALRRAARKLG
jgi:hypothetical protein